MDEWIKDVWCIIQGNLIQPWEKNDILLFAPTWMDFESFMLGEMLEKNKCRMIALICGN